VGGARERERERERGGRLSTFGVLEVETITHWKNGKN